MPNTLPDGTEFRFVVEWGRTSPGSLSVYDVAEYGSGIYDGAGTIGWTPATGFTLSMSTRRGKDQFGKRFRTGTCRIVLDNANGRWATSDAGFRPGDFVRVNVEVTAPAGGAPVTAPVFYGRVDESTFNLKAGVDVLTVRVVGRFAEWAVIDQTAQAEVGAGELSQARMSRLFTEFGFDFTTVTEYGVPQYTMQGTTLAQPALTLAQVTMDSEGGDFAELPDGSFMIGYRDWLTTAPHSTTIQWNLGGIGVGIEQAQPSLELQLVVNDSTVANTGGAAQNSTDADSNSRYGRRTTRRLDLIGDKDSQSVFLAQRQVAALKDVRPRVRSVTVRVVDHDSAQFAQNVKFGDLVQVVVSSINGWGVAFLSHVIGVEHATAGVTWSVTCRLDDAFVSNVDGGFDENAFSAGFQLGTPLPLATGATEGNPGVFTPPENAIPQNFATLVAGEIVASPLTAWAAGSHVILGDTSQAYWDAASWQPGAAPTPPATGATEGNPGVFTPPGSLIPFDFAQLVTDGIVASPLTAWAEGSHVILGDTSHAYWDAASWQVGDAPAPPVLPSKYVFAGAESVQTTNYLETFIDAGFVMELDFQVDNLNSEQIVAGMYGSARRFALDVTTGGSIRFAILLPANQFTRITSSISAVPGVTYHAILSWTPSTLWSLNIDGNVNNGTPPDAIRAGSGVVSLGNRSNNTLFMTGFIEDWTLTPATAQAAEVITADSGIGNISGATWTDQFGTAWIANGGVIASGGS